MSADRRARFREYMRCLNPTGDPKQAVADELYVRTPLGTSDRIVKRLEIEPQSSHLVVGGIGSGKTIELRIVERELVKGGEPLVVFLDVPSHQDLSELRPGVLLGLVGLAIGETIENEAPEGSPAWGAIVAMQQVALGREEIRASDNKHTDTLFVHVPGVLTEPKHEREVDVLEASFRRLLSVIHRPVVALLDGLDRAPISGALQQMVYRDVAAFERAGVGVVMVGPQALQSVRRFGQMKDCFTVSHLHGAADAGSSTGHAFLDNVLKSRDPAGLLSSASRSEVIRWCGGTLRDLLSLARAAGEEAYATGADVVQLDHVSAAADRFGRSLLLGATQAMVDRLLDLKPVVSTEQGDPFRAEVHFTAATEADVDLLAHRLLVEVPGPTVRYFLHPTVALLSSGLRKSA
jgi:hypothetical protein